MRPAFFGRLLECYERDESIVVMTGDLGFKLFDGFREADPSRFINAGIAEANMVGVAAGLALEGRKVFCYSIIPFLVMRAFEQVRLDVSLHRADVNLVGVGGGFTYGKEGFTHFGLEDIAMMRLLPHMEVVVPADPVAAAAVARMCVSSPGPRYIRLGKTGEPRLYPADASFDHGKPVVVKDGADAVVFAVGSMLKPALDAAALLERDGIDAAVVDVMFVRPLDVDMVGELAARFPVVVTVEEHSVVGGIGDAIGAALLEGGYRGAFRKMGVNAVDVSVIGDGDYLRKHYGLDAASIAAVVKDAMEGGSRWK